MPQTVPSIRSRKKAIPQKGHELAKFCYYILVALTLAALQMRHQKKQNGMVAGAELSKHHSRGAIQRWEGLVEGEEEGKGGEGMVINLLYS